MGSRYSANPSYELVAKVGRFGNGYVQGFGC